MSQPITRVRDEISMINEDKYKNFKAFIICLIQPKSLQQNKLLEGIVNIILNLYFQPDSIQAKN